MQEPSLENLRCLNRQDLWESRKEKRNTSFKQHRVFLSEIDLKLSNQSPDQFKELVSKVKLKKTSIDVLKLIKNNCYVPRNAEIFFKTVGALDSLIRILMGNDALMQIEAAACLTNLSCSSHKASLRIAKSAGAYLVLFINSQSSYLQDKSAWAAGNIAKDCFDCFQILKAQGLLSSLNSALKVCSPEHLTSVVYCLHACSTYNDSGFLSIFTSENVEHLLKINADKNICMKTRVESGFTVANAYHISVQNNVNISETNVDVIVRNLHDSVKDLEFEVSHPLVRCLGILSTCDIVCKQLFDKAEFSKTVDIIFKEESFLRNEMIWILTNMSTCCADFDFSFLLQHARSFLYPGNPCILQVLYFLCIAVVKCPAISQNLFDHLNVKTQIELLSKCGETEIENASEVFRNLLNVNSCV